MTIVSGVVTMSKVDRRQIEEEEEDGEGNTIYPIKCNHGQFYC